MLLHMSKRMWENPTLALLYTGRPDGEYTCVIFACVMNKHLRLFDFSPLSNLANDHSWISKGHGAIIPQLNTLVQRVVAMVKSNPATFRPAQRAAQRAAPQIKRQRTGREEFQKRRMNPGLR